MALIIESGKLNGIQLAIAILTSIVITAFCRAMGFTGVNW